MVRFYLEFTLGLPNPYKLMYFDRNINGNKGDTIFVCLVYIILIDFEKHDF